MKVLPDTSIWVDFLRDGDTDPSGELRRLLRAGSVMVCGPVVAEVFVGMGPQDQADAGRSLAGLPWADLDREAWIRIGEVGSELRATGVTVALTDITIAVAAVQAEAAVWTRDRDLHRIKRVLSGLRLHTPS